MRGKQIIHQPTYPSTERKVQYIHQHTHPLWEENIYSFDIRTHYERKYYFHLHTHTLWEESAFSINIPSHWDISIFLLTYPPTMGGKYYLFWHTHAQREKCFLWHVPTTMREKCIASFEIPTHYERKAIFPSTYPQRGSTFSPSAYPPAMRRKYLFLWHTHPQWEESTISINIPITHPLRGKIHIPSASHLL